jgi:hypothetical protein
MYDPISTFHIARRHGDDLAAEAEHRRLARSARRGGGRRARGAEAAGTTSLNRIRPPAPAA